MKTHRIAIIGVGAIATVHARAIADIEHAELVAGVCRTQEKGRAFAQETGCKWYDDYEQMLEDEQPSIATICTPSGAHLEPALSCARRGVHILCEKPLEITSSRVDQMIRATEQAGITLGGIFPQRFNPVIQVIQQAAAAGRFGNLAVLNGYVPWWRDDAYYQTGRWQGTMALDGGGALMNQAIHVVDAMTWIAASAMGLTREENPVEQVFALTAKRGHDPGLIEVEDAAVAVLRFRNGALGQVLGATSMYPGTLKRIQVAGRDGTAEVLEDELITWRFRSERSDDPQIRHQFGEPTQTGGGASDPMAIDYSNHRRNIVAFLDALAGENPVMLDGPEARKAVVIIEAMYESARSGAPVTV